MKSLYKLAMLLLVLLVMVSAVQAQPFEARYAGTTVQLQGQVTDSDGNPIAGAVVEIWQTDVNGNYNHPGDSDPSILLQEFQYFGVATTDENGYYAFLTVKTAPYESRPAHIHYKVKMDGQDVFTSQWYFEEDRVDVEADGVFGSGSDTLFLKTNPDVEADLADDGMRVATANVVLDLNGSGADTLTPTAAQTEGPYYPMIDFSTYDNNLNSTAADDETVLPVLETTAVAATECTRLNLNELTEEQLLATIPNFPNRMVREFLEYRPYVSIQQFRREIGKYVGEAQVAEWEPYVYVPVDPNNVDAETLMQLPGVDETIAANLIAGRPYASNEAFLSALGQAVDAQQAAEAGCYLVATA